MSKSPTSKRTVIDFKTIDKSFDFELGKVTHINANTPMEAHIHPGAIEITYFIKGEQVYSVEGQNYNIHSGEVFVTFPDEIHSSGSYPKDKSQIYYLIVGTSSNGWLTFNVEEEKLLFTKLLSMTQRVFKVSPGALELLDQLLANGLHPTTFNKTIIRNLLSQFLIKILEDEEQSLSHPIDTMQEILDYIHHHIHENISISTLAHLSGLSEGRFKTNFRNAVGLPPREYILRQKIRRAKQLLEHPSLTITDIGYELGFCTSQYFSTVFKRFTSLSPSEYRELIDFKTL